MFAFNPINVTINYQEQLNNKHLNNKFDNKYPVIVLTNKNINDSFWELLPCDNNKSIQTLWENTQEKFRKNFAANLPNNNNTPICFLQHDPEKAVFDQLTNIKNLITQNLQERLQYINIINIDLEPNYLEFVLKNLITGIVNFYSRLPKYTKSFEHNEHNDNDELIINLWGVQTQYDFNAALAEAHGNSLARRLSILPPNLLTTANYTSYVKILAKQYNWDFELYDLKKLKKLNAGAFLAVAQGSTHTDSGIIHLQYRTKNRTEKTKNVALVGKGICFDTGGYNLKVGSTIDMHAMKHDMTGSAIALGSLLALTLMEAPFDIDCWLALAENEIGPEAYKPSDIVFAANGTSIEVINTDAEGRMILADTLFFASQKQPNLIFDYATLTGCCVYAIDTFYSGMMTNKGELTKKLIDIGFDCGERLWPFPNTPEYDEDLKSDVADIKQCATKGYADVIRAGRFLNKFVDAKIPWVHIDLSAANHKGGLGLVTTDTTGFGVRYTIYALIYNDLLQIL